VPSAREPESGSLPQQIQQLLTSITSTLNALFSKYPPHTVQRLAELIINPKQHYRSLPSYLHAVDRVVHVTSGANTFPLPPAIPDPSSAAVLSNGGSVDPFSVSWSNTTSGLQAGGLGSDESLGGALLTPILWLGKNGNGNTHSPLEGEVKTESTEMIEGPNGLGGIETVSVSVNGISSTRGDSASASASPSGEGHVANLRAEGGVTQGELLRQEQRAGVVPVAQLSGNRGDSDGMGEDDEMPHARGPEEIGMEDMGPQSASSGSERGGPRMAMQGIDVEAAVGRKAEIREEVKPERKEGEAPGTPKREADDELGPNAKRPKEDKTDEDTEIVNVDGKTEEEEKVSEEGGNEAEVDTSTEAKSET
jgi:hypothetical protein